jgi:hypothetical protein
MCKGMPSVSNYGLPVFFADTRQGPDGRGQEVHERQNSAIKGAVPMGCGDEWINNAMANSIGMVPGGNSGGMPPCAADVSNDLHYGIPGTIRTKGNRQLFTRMFGTTPNLHNGNPDSIIDENRLLYNNGNVNRKSVNTVSDKQWPIFTPLIPERVADIPEHNYFVEPFARGGVPSRNQSMTRVDLLKQ